MTDQQLQFYRSLSDTEKHIINVAVLKASRIFAADVATIVQKRYKVTQKQVSECLELAAKKKIFNDQSEYYGSSKRYTADGSTFMIYLYPFLSDYQNEWNTIEASRRSQYYGEQDLSKVSQLLYYLLYDEKMYRETENLFLRSYYALRIPDLSEMLLMDPYLKVLPRMGLLFLRAQFEFLSDRCFYTLSSLTFVNERLEAARKNLDPAVSLQLSRLDPRMYFHRGDFKRSVDSLDPDELYNELFIDAVGLLLSGEVEQALGLFEKGMKVQRSYFRGLVLPYIPEYALFYLIALCCASPEASALVFSKYLKYFEKKEVETHHRILVAVAAFSLSNKQSLDIAVDYLQLFSKGTGDRFFGLLSIPVWYLIDKKPEKFDLHFLIMMIRNAGECGYLVLAYEAAFVLKSWSNSPEVLDLYQQIAAHFSYQPALSLIVRQEGWEKSLNAFLSIDRGKTNAASANTKGSKYKLCYFINFSNGTIQPVLQTRTVKGWSKGRNVALKTLLEGNVEGMNEQDLRIAKHVKRYDRGWGGGGTEFLFNDTVFRDLAGHPYLYLDGTDFVPVELVVTQPVLQVKNTEVGYILSTNIKDLSKRLFVEKETNTRYKLYDLNQQQVQLIEQVLQQKMVVPEKGKEKLMQVLGLLSAHMTVHSDLVATESMNVRIVPPDSRIRVQLLPFGETLKAELFAKPFGDRPPYCRPGKGGKTLIGNDKTEQLQVSRNLEQEMENASVLMAEIQALESIDQNDGLISFNEASDSLQLLEILSKHTAISLVEWPEGVRFKLQGSVGFKNLNLQIKSKNDWFELEGELKVNEQTILTLQQLMELTSKSRNRFIELKPGEFLALSEQLRKQLDEIRALSSTSKEGLHLNKFASVSLGDVLEESGNLQTDKKWKEFRKRLKNVNSIDYKVPEQLNADLRSYQEEGFVWMCRLAEWEGGACLADDMGLGKTVQALAVLLHRSAKGPAMVVCPMSVLPNWVSEVGKFAPSLQVKLLFTNNREQTLQSLKNGDLLLVTYGLMQSEEKALAAVQFATVVLDEAHTIKNTATKTSKAAMKLNASFKVALTGTPVQNYLGEVWNLFQFINPGLLGSLAQFNERFVKNDTPANRKYLKKLLSPFILRRTKAAVLDELPSKTEIVLKVQLSEEERAFYETLRRQAIANMEKDDTTTGSKHLQALAEITRLRQACCNVSLINPGLKIASSKLADFMELVSDLRKNNHRALVYSQFVTHLNFVREALDKQGVSYLYLDGSTSLSEREKRVNAFQSGEGDLFLLSLKAGGLGLNLTAADFVIHLDPWWNPAVEDQASDRAHRMGQNRPVTIYRLVAEDSIEEKIIRLHSTKRNLADSLLEGTDKAAKLSLSELMDLITAG
jgi:SNF2 family DNA or RNA helicase